MDNKIFVIAKREYVERVRSRWFIMTTLAVPALIAAIAAVTIWLGTRANASSTVRNIEIVDASGAHLGDRVAAALMADSSLGRAGSASPRVVAVTAAQLAAAEAAATEEVKQPNHIAGYLVLNDSTLRGESARYAGRNASSVSDMDKLQTTIREQVMMARLEREGVRPDIVGDLAKGRLHLDSERLNEKGRAGSGMAGFAAGFIVGILLFMSILMHGQAVMRGVLEEKTTRVAEVVISSVRPESLLAGKVIGVGAVGITQQLLWIVIGGYLTSFITPILLKGTAAGAVSGGGGASGMQSVLGAFSIGMIAVALAYFLIGFAFYATLYAAAGAMVNSDQEAQQAAVPVMLLAMSTWLLVNPVMLAPNGTLAVVLSWLPWSSPIIMPMRMGVTSVSPLSVAGSMLVAVVGTFGAIWLSARIYRVGMLMYGKKPSFGELVKWIRYA